MFATNDARSVRTRADWRGPRAALPPPPFPWDVRALLRRSKPPEPVPMGGIIVRGLLNDAESLWLMQTLDAMAIRDSEEIDGLKSTAAPEDAAHLNPENRPQPFVTWTHPYTRCSNCVERPSRLLRWAEELMHALVGASRDQEIDSMLAQMYHAGGSLLPHRDEDLSWGLGLSLGATADFDCMPEGEPPSRVVIRSGDLMVGEFGQMRHAVRVREEPPSALPPWWAGAVRPYGAKARCNVLFRRALSEREQRALAESRARSVYGISLQQLQAQTGRDLAFLSVHLRHASLE
jgi:alkylated DNA repair dioxygenase AlkB